MLRHPVLLALLAVVPIPLAGQQDSDLAAGTRVRINGRFVGTTFDLLSDTLVVWGGADGSSDSWLVGRDEIDKLEVSRGMKSNWKTGMWIGTLGGGAIGALVGAAGCEEGFIGRDDCIAALGLAGMLIGMPLGTITGALIKTERWEKVPMEAVRVSVVSRGGGVAVRVSIAY